MADIWSVVDTKTGKIEKSGFDKKQDAKALRNELNKPVNEKKKAEQPFTLDMSLQWVKSIRIND